MAVLPDHLAYWDFLAYSPVMCAYNVHMCVGVCVFERPFTATLPPHSCEICPYHHRNATSSSVSSHTHRDDGSSSPSIHSSCITEKHTHTHTRGKTIGIERFLCGVSKRKPFSLDRRTVWRWYGNAFAFFHFKSIRNRSSHATIKYNGIMQKKKERKKQPTTTIYVQMIQVFTITVLNTVNTQTNVILMMVYVFYK